MKRTILIFALCHCARLCLALDQNQDGISDVWAQMYPSQALRPNDDDDGDGFSNAVEAAFGTNPFDKLSAPNLEMLTGSVPNELPLRIQTENGKRYELQTSSDLVTWTTVGPDYTGTGWPVTIYTTVLDSADSAFFRYRVLDVDADGDGLTAWEEIQLGSRDDSVDSDGDGLTDVQEFLAHSNPGKADSDGDGISDYDEVNVTHTDPNQFNTATGNTVGLTSGKLSVGNNGAASYSIPISVSPGTAGMQPKLGFEYSSRGGNGMMGVGWSISGLSAISRAPQTRAQDNAIHGVDFSTADRFAMDGQRLIAVNGSDGANGTEYRTEIDSFTKVISNGNSGSGPASFTAYTKSGLIYTFGDTTVSPNSRFLARGRSDALSWGISKIADRSGNYMIFNYNPDQSNGEYRITSIEYTKNDGAGLTSSYASVVFDYEDRPDIANGYIAGSQTYMGKRLTTVTSKYGSQIVRQYKLTYQVSPATNRSRLVSIQEGAGDLSNPATLAFNPTTFAWSDDDVTSVQGQLQSSTTYDSVDETKERWLQGDFTGDGRSDMARVTNNSSGTHIDVIATQTVPPTQGESFAMARWVDVPSSSDAYHQEDQWVAGDFDGDGKVDVLRLYQDSNRNFRIQLYRNQGNSFSAPTTCTIDNTTLPYKTNMLVYPADMDGNGLLDLLVIFGNGAADGLSGRNQYIVFLNQGTTGTQTSFTGSFWRIPGDNADNNNDQAFNLVPQLWHVGDIDGDGLPDIVYLMNVNATYEVHPYLNKQGTFVPQTVVYGTGLPGRYDLWESGDFNGDGLLDLVRLVKTSAPADVPSVSVYLATGTGSFIQESWSGVPRVPESSSTDPNSKDGEVIVGDFDGDGRSDIGIVSTTPYVGASPSPTPDPSPPPCHGPKCNPLDVNVVVDANATAQQITYQETKYMSNGTTSFRQVGNSLTNTISSQYAVIRRRWFQADFNGDGKEDLARVYVWNVSSTEQRVGCDVWSTVAGVHDLLTSVSDGMSSTNSVSYTTLADSNIYSKSTDSLSGAIDLMTPMPVVSSISYDAGGTISPYAINYQYNGLKADRLRGLLGFRKVTSTDMRTGVFSIATMRQDFPFTGMAIQSETHQPNNGLLSLSTSEYRDDVAPQGSKVRMPYSHQTIADTYELDGTSITHTTTTVNAIDSYGNTGNLVVTSADGWSKTTVSSYDNDPVNWKLGQLRASTVTSAAPNQDPVIRKSGFDYTSTGEVQDETIEPDHTSTSLWSNTAYTPDGFGNNQMAKTTGSDIQDRTTTTIYDNKGRFVYDIGNALDQHEIRTYEDRWGKVASITGPNGLTASTIYDDFGRERLTTRPDKSRTITTYHKASDDSDAPGDASYFVRTEVDGAAPVTVFFDRLGREIRKKTLSGVPASSNPKTIFVDTTYNDRGMVETVSRPYFAGESKYVASTFYDIIGRAYQVQTPKEGGGLATTSNAFHGLEVDTINPEQQGTGLKTTTKKDSQGHLIKVTDAKNGTIDYTYDPTGNLIKVVQNGNVTQMHYDVRGRKDWMDDPDLGYWSYTYNSLGELISQTDANSQSVTMHYDKLGRLDSRIESEGTSTWEYDTAQGKGVGKLKTARFDPLTGSGLSPYQRTMVYDSLGRPQSDTELVEAKNYITSTYYDALSRVEFVTYPDSVWVRNLYDKNGYLNEVQRYDGYSFWKAKDYDAEGHLKQQQLGNGVVTDRAYTPETGVLKTIHSGLNGGAGIQNLEYTFSIIGNLTNRTDHLQTVSGTTLKEDFLYDELNRVRTATVAGQAAKNLTYDGSGNITSKDGVGTYSYVPVAGSLQANERPHPHAVRRINGVSMASYDMNGNMTTDFDRTMTWTSFNMPKLITRPNAANPGTNNSSYFTYDVDHSRITQVATTNGYTWTTTYVGAGIYEEVTDGTTKIDRKHYINTPAGRVAIYTSTVDLTVAHLGDITYNTKYVHTDHLGSTDVVTDESGSVVERDSFDAWGFRRTTDWVSNDSSARSIITRGYTGHEQLDDLGLVHMNGRVYDPGLGRFLSADPTIQAPTITQNYNRYSYVLNNPLSLTDPSGFNFLNNFGKWLNHALGSTGAQIVIGVVAVVVGVATAGAGLAVVGSLGFTVLAGGALTTTGLVVAGAGFGFGSAFISTSLSGASIGQALEAGVISGIIGGVTADAGATFLKVGATAGLGEVAAKGAGHVLLAGSLSAAASAVEHSSIRDGFIGAAISALLSPVGGTGGGFGGIALRVAASAIAGGTAAELTGGKFANGAITGAFVRLFQEEMSIGSQTGTKNAGSATAPGFNALALVGNLVGKVWALPNTIIGLAIGIASLPFGGEFLGWHDNAFQFGNVPFGRGGALTLGNVELYHGASPSDYTSRYDDPRGPLIVQFRLHEMAHTFQNQILGILFLPAYLANGGIGAGNPFENAADNYATHTGGWWPGTH